MIGGLTTDILVITGVPSIGVSMIVYASSGAFGNLAGSFVETWITKEKNNIPTLIIDSIFGAATGALFGTIDGPRQSMIDEITGSAGEKALKRGIDFAYAATKTSLRELGKIGSTFVEEALKSFTSWFIKEYTKYIIGD